MVTAVSEIVILAMLRFLSPNGDQFGRYGEISRAIAETANADPLYVDREDGSARGASILVAIAWYESRFSSSAVGDGGKSLGLFQIMPAVWKLDANSLLLPRSAAPIAMALVKRSFRECRDRPWGQRLAWYAASATCAKDKVHPKILGQSLERMHLADKLFRRFFPELDVERTQAGQAP